MSDFIFVPGHGQSQANADGIIADAHSPLTETGLSQARETAGALRGSAVTRIACSPYLRAWQTAETIAAELGIEISSIAVIEELRERGLGACEGEPKSQPSAWYSLSDDDDLESKQHLLNRMHVALAKVDALAAAGGGTLVVGHAISGLYLAEAANGVKAAAGVGLAAQLGNADFLTVRSPAEPASARAAGAS